MMFKEIAFQSNTYQLTLALRNQVLRQPLGLILSEKDTLNEELHRHFVLLNESEVIACLVIITDHSKQSVKLKQMAVSDMFRKQGLGSSLITKVEAILRTEGIIKIVLSARITAIPFYETLGYLTQGNEYIEQTIPHIMMSKSL